AEIAQQETFNREEPAVWLPVADKKQTRARTALLQTPAAPWVPEASTQVLSLQKKVFLAQALMLRRAPAEARTVAFQKKLLQWQARAESTNLAESGTDHVAQAPAPAASQQKFSASAMVEQVDASETPNGFQPASSSNKGSQVALQPIGDLNAATPENQDVQGELGPEAHAAAKTAVPAKDAPIATAAYSPQQGVSNQEVVLMPEPASTLAAKPDLAQAQTAELSTTLETEFGGIFFLLSLTLYLYIYGDFTSPAEPGLELNIWDFLALMAHELTGGAVEKDTLWEQLASLAGRPKSVKPGLAFAPPDEWRVSQEWLAPFSHDYDPRPILINGRMISMHPAGFIVTDVPAETDSQFDLNEAIGLAGRLQRWVGWMASYFRARLVLALGREDAVALLCTRPARIVFTLTHIDVTFSLDHHPIELRMAGLDRDLGWIPAAGRYVAFHFK
ncbi:MAG TPA: hypothetical protein VH724_03140, partial [Candidatus Angelobacter sp.]|nr:hypothetical protein [Candidatus Angelobacter sp.]